MIVLLHFDCFSGISGDMCLGALIDLGVPFEHIESELRKLDVSGYTLGMDRVLVQGIESVKFQVYEETLNPESGAQEPLVHEHHHRTYLMIRELITKSSLSEEIKSYALRIFLCLAKAEASVHGVSVEEVHFHEVGGGRFYC